MFTIAILARVSFITVALVSAMFKIQTGSMNARSIKTVVNAYKIVNIKQSSSALRMVLYTIENGVRASSPPNRLRVKEKIMLLNQGI